MCGINLPLIITGFQNRLVGKGMRQEGMKGLSYLTKAANSDDKDK